MHCCVICWLAARIANDEKKQEVRQEHRFVDAPECIGKIDHDWVCGYVKEKVSLTDAQFGNIKVMTLRHHTTSSASSSTAR